MRLLHSLTILIVLCWASIDAQARTIVVAVDVSGSMATYGAWQSDAQSQLKLILSGLAYDKTISRWSLSGSTNSLATYHLGAGDQLVVLRFGDVNQNSEYPFFRDIGPPISLAEFERSFPTDPSIFRQSRTNKSLAECVAAKTAGKDGLVVIVSDFLVDARLSDLQVKFIDDFASGMSVRTNAILSWVQNPRVQIRFLQYSENLDGGLRAQPSDPSAGTGSLRLNTPKLTRDDALELSWSFDGVGAPRSYDVEIMGLPDQRQLFLRKNLLGTSVTFENPPRGVLSWTVTATLDDGRTVRGRSTYTHQGGSGLFGLLIGLLAIAGVVAAIMFALTRPGMVSKLFRSESRKAANKL